MKTIAKSITAVGVAALALVGVAGTTSTTKAAALSPADQQKILDLHNKYRADVGSPPVQWDDTLAANSQVVADRALLRPKGQGVLGGGDL